MRETERSAIAEKASSFILALYSSFTFWVYGTVYLGRALVEKRSVEAFWQRDVEESVNQGNSKQFTEEAVMQVSNWGFSLADLQVQKKYKVIGFLNWITSIYSRPESELTGFLWYLGFLDPSVWMSK